MADDASGLLIAAGDHPGEDVPLLMLADLRQERGDELGAFMLRWNVEVRNALRGVARAFNSAVQTAADEHCGGNYAAALTALSEFQKGRG